MEAPKFSDRIKRQSVGLSLTSRVTDCINLCASLQQDTQDLYLDVSQDLQRKPWSKKSLATLTRSSEVFSYDRCRSLVGHEYLRALGFPAGSPEMIIPEGTTDAQLKDLAGDAMALPAVSLVETALLLASRM